MFMLLWQINIVVIMNITNSKGAKIDTWGTPLKTSIKHESLPFTRRLSVSHLVTSFLSKLIFYQTYHEL